MKTNALAMVRKLVALATLSAFLVSIQACTIYTTKKFGPDKADRYQSRRITRVLKKDGEIFDFSEQNPGWIEKDRVFCPTPEIETGHVASMQIAVWPKKSGRGGWVVTKDEIRHSLLSFKKSGDGYDFVWLKTMSVPLSDVQLLWAKDVNKTASGFASLGTGVLVAGGILLGFLVIVALTKDSCPFLYADDGAGFRLEGELYSGAVFRDTERLDFLKLHHLSERGGRYTLRIANEALETQMTDLLSLLVVDHPDGVEVLAGADGDVRTVRAPAAPAEAIDSTGRDCREALAASDGRLWSSNPVGRDPEKAEDLRASVTVKFPIPAGAKIAKLAVRIGNTYWADYVFGRLFGLMGNLMPAWYRKTEADPKIRGAADRFMRDQGVSLRVLKLRDGRWQEAGAFLPTGPFGIQDDILALPLAANEPGPLTLKLEGGTFFWMIDSARVDFSADIPVETRELSAETAVDEDGTDVRGRLLRADGVYHVMPDPGHFAAVTFAAPPPRPGMKRSFIVKSEGYYTIHPRSHAAPDLETLSAIRRDPGLFLKFSLREFQKTLLAARPQGR